MKMKLIRLLQSGSEYAMPGKYSDLPCFRIQDGMPQQTSFNQGELSSMIYLGLAEVVGEVKLTLTLERDAS